MPPNPPTSVEAPNQPCSTNAVRQLATFFELSGDIMMVCDPDATIRRANPAVFANLGYRPEELLGRSFRDLTHPSDLALTDAKYAQVLSSTTIVHCETRFRHKAGKYRWLRWSCSFDPSQKLAFCVARDSTDKRRAVRRQKREHREKLALLAKQVSLRKDLESLLDNMTESHVALAADWRIVRVNKEFARKSGMAADKQVGKNFLELYLFRPEDRHSKYWECYHRAMKERVAVQFEEYYAPFDNWTAVIAYPVRNGGLAIYSRNIDQQKRFERKLFGEKRKAESMFLGSPAAIALWEGIDLVLEQANQAELDIFSGRELIGLPFREAFPELAGQPFEDMLRSVFLTGQPIVRNEMLARLKDSRSGELVNCYFDVAYIPMVDEEGKRYGVLDYSIDVSEKVLSRQKIEHSQRQLTAAIDELKQERDLRERFVSTLSHDLRVPIAGALLGAQALCRRLKDDAVGRHKAARIISSMERADKMLQNLLDVTMIKGGDGIPIRREPCNLADVIHGVLAMANDTWGTRFRFICGIEPQVMMLDRFAIERVLENLLSNAVKYGSDTAAITITVSQSERDVCVAVHNQGSVIAFGDREALFEPFRRSASAQSSEQKGWGIGLTLVKGIAQAHGGRVDVDSSPIDGSTFFVRLPKIAPP